MSRRTTGFGFIFIAAMLFGIRYLAAAIYGSSQTSWNSDLFGALLSYVDQGITPVIIIALILGVIYLLWAELSTKKQT